MKLSAQLSTVGKASDLWTSDGQLWVQFFKDTSMLILYKNVYYNKNLCCLRKPGLSSITYVTIMQLSIYLFLIEHQVKLYSVKYVLEYFKIPSETTCIHCLKF